MKALCFHRYFNYYFTSSVDSVLVSSILTSSFTGSSLTSTTGSSLTVSTTSSTTGVLVSIAGASTTSLAKFSCISSSAKFSFRTISLVSILAPTFSFVLADFPKSFS